MGRETKRSYADLQGHLVDPSNWPEGPEGAAAREAFLKGMDLFTAGAVDRKDAEVKAQRFLGILSGVVEGVPGLLDIRKLVGL